MHVQEMRDVLTDIISEITSTQQLESYECLKLIADIQRFVLTLFVHEQFNDYKLLYVILESSQNVFYCKEKKRKVYLSSLLYDHGIWSDMNNWKECIDYMLRLKIEDALRRKKRKEQLDKQQAGHVNFFERRFDPKSDQNIFKRGFKNLKGIIQTQEEKFKADIKTNQNLIFNELSRFVTYFTTLSLPYEAASGALLWSCELYQVEKSKTHILLTELKSNQKNPSKMFTDHEVLVQSLQKRSNRLCKLGYSDMTLIVGCSIKYIDSDITLRNILLVSKDFNDILSNEVLKQALLRTDQDRIQRKRKTLWLKLLKIDPQYIIPEFQVYQ